MKNLFGFGGKFGSFLLITPKMVDDDRVLPHCLRSVSDSLGFRAILKVHKGARF